MCISFVLSAGVQLVSGFSKGSESGQRLRVCGSPRSGVLGSGPPGLGEVPHFFSHWRRLPGFAEPRAQSPLQVHVGGVLGVLRREVGASASEQALKARGGTERALALAQELRVGHMPQKASGCSSRQVFSRFQQLAGTRKMSLPPTGRSAKSRRAGCLKWASDCQEKGIWDPRMLKIPRAIDSLSVKKWVRADCGAPCAQLHPLLPLTNPLPYTP